MKCILLPGNNAEHNRKYSSDFSQFIENNLGIKTQVLSYFHWLSNGETNFKDDVEKLGGLLETIGAKENFIVLCKSYGNGVLQNVVEQSIHNVDCPDFIYKMKHIFHFGLPRIPETEVDVSNFITYIRYKNIKHTFIQQTSDKYLPYNKLEHFLFAKNLNRDCKLIEVPGSDHRYDKFDEFIGMMKESVK